MATEKRLILADVTVDAFTKWLTSTYDGRMPADIVNEIPTVDAVEVVHGRWLTLEEYAEKISADPTGYAGGWRFCSECEQPMRELYGWAYCPNCGAKMDGDGNEKA